MESHFLERCKPLIFSLGSVYYSISCTSCFKRFWWLWKEFGFIDIGKVNTLYPYFIIGGRQTECPFWRKMKDSMTIYIHKTYKLFQTGKWDNEGMGEGAESSSQRSLQKAGHQLHFGYPGQHHLTSGMQPQTSERKPAISTVHLKLCLELSNIWRTAVNTCGQSLLPNPPLWNLIQFSSSPSKSLSGSHISEDYTDTISWHSGLGGSKFTSASSL